MIVYDKEQKQIVIPNGLGNVNIIINGGDCPECPEQPGCNLGDLVKEITENGNYVYYPSNDGLDGYKMADIRINVPGGDTGAVIQDYKWVRPSMADRAENGDIYIRPDEGFDAVGYIDLDPNDIYNEGVEAGRAEGGGCTLTSRTFTSNGVYHPEPEQMRTIWFTADKPSAYDTGVKLVDDSWVEIYFRATEGGDTPTLIGCEDADWNSTAFATRWYNNYLSVKIGINEESIPYTAGDDKLHKLKFGKTVGVWLDDVKVSDIAGEEWVPTNHTLYIGAMNDPSNNNEKGFWRPWVGYIGDVTVYGSLNETVGEYHFKAGDYGRYGEFKRVEDNTNLPNLGGDGMAIAQTQQYGEAPDGYNEITVNVPQYNLGTLDWTLTSPSTEVKNASDDGYDGYSQVTIRPENVIAQEKERAINDFKNKMQEITITKNGTYSTEDQEILHSIAFDGNSYFNTGIVPTENIKIEACIKVTNGNNSGLGGIIIGGGIDPVDLANPNSTENRGIAIGMGGGAIYGIWGAKKSWNNPYKYEGEGTTTVVLQKTNDSWGWETEKGSFGASTLYIGGYNRNGEEVEEKFLQSIVYIKIWTNKDDDSTMALFRPKNMAQGGFGVVNSGGTEYNYVENIGTGTATFVEENVKKYPNGFKRVEVNVPDLNGSYDEGYAQGQADIAANARVLNVTENGVYQSESSDPIPPTLVTGIYADGTKFHNYAELNGKVFNTKIAGSVNSRLEFWYKGDNTVAGDGWNAIIGAGNVDNRDCFQVRYWDNNNGRLLIEIGNSGVNYYDWDDTVWHHLIISKAEGLWIDGDKKWDFRPSNTINGEFLINGTGYNVNSNANGCFGMIKIDDVVIIPTANGFLNTNTGELLEVVKDGGYTFTENLPIYGEGKLYKTVNVNVVPQVSIKEAGLNVWYNDLKRITDENDQINSDWDQALQGETIQNVFPGIAMTISGQAVAKPFFIDRVNGNSTATKIGKLVSTANGTPVSCAVVIIGAFDCKNIQTVDLEAFKYMTDLCFIDGMNGLGESFTSPQTIDFTYCTNLFIKANNKKYISNFAESLFNLSAGNKNSINTSTLKFKSAVQERSGNADAIALMQSKGWTVEFV